MVCKLQLNGKLSLAVRFVPFGFDRTSINGDWLNEPGSP